MNMTLKPCPFCGGEAEAYEFEYPYDKFGVMCKRCHSQTKLSAKEESVIEAWNTRAERTCSMERDEWYPCAEDDCNRLHMPRWFCSECEDDMVGAKPNYCPNCGAKVVDDE